MLEEDFLKERQNIREKMLKYSRAINQGKPLDEELKDEFSSDDILRRRFKNKRKVLLEDFEESKTPKQSNIYLKEDLINVKLEEKQSLAFKILSQLKKRKERKKKEKLEKKTKKNFSLKKNESKILKKSKDILESKKPYFKNNNEKGEISNPKFKEKNKTQNPQEDTILNKTSIRIYKNVNSQKTNPKTLNEDSEKTKNALLEGFSVATKEDKNLNPSHLFFAILTVSFALFLFIPQIYIRNQIYYLSREIATLRTEENVLSEESKELKRKLENMRFQNQILDYLE